MENLVTLERPLPLRAGLQDTALKVLVTGADGFIGSVMTPYLRQHGFDVTGLDTGYYRAGLLYHDGEDRPATLTRDIRKLTAADLEGFDAVPPAWRRSPPRCRGHGPEAATACRRWSW